MKFLIGLNIVLIMLGGCGIMNEAGEIQPICVVMALVGAMSLFFISRRYHIEY